MALNSEVISFLRFHSHAWQLQRIIKQYQSYQSVYSEMLAEFHFQLHQENYIHVYVAVQVWPKFNQHLWKWREKTVELYVWILSFPNETLELYTSKKIHYT